MQLADFLSATARKTGPEDTEQLIYARLGPFPAFAIQDSIIVRLIYDQTGVELPHLQRGEINFALFVQFQH